MKSKVLKLIQMMMVISINFFNSHLFGQYDFYSLNIHKLSYDYRSSNKPISKPFLVNILQKKSIGISYKKKTHYQNKRKFSNKIYSYFRFKVLLENKLPTNIQYSDTIYFDINFVKFDLLKGETIITELFKIDTVYVLYFKPFQYYEIKININKEWRRLVIKVNKKNSKILDKHFNLKGGVKMMINELLSQIIFIQEPYEEYRFNRTRKMW